MIMKNLEHYKTIFEHFHEAVYIVDQERQILYFNPEASRISGFSQGETEGFFCYDNILNHVDEQGLNLCFVGCPLTEAMKENHITDHMVYLHHKEGHRVKVHVRAIPVIEDSKVVGAIEVFTDQTHQNEMMKEIEKLKEKHLIDDLTGLYLRRFLSEKLKKHLELHGETQVGILMIDIDDFKWFNDSYGHDVGDEVLRIVSKTIKYHLKQKDVVIRYGGEEILVLLLDVNQEDMLSVAETLRILVSQSYLRDESDFDNITVSIGATLWRKNEKIQNAIKRADLAMYKSKQNDKNQVQIL
ncbi:MAG TPA: GGDEF domain-containing protein [Acholeplasmataceae bacterium]|nr:GGDEF domain-containing protein [Acholeplasmataceae bacterium]HBO68215.1 GGDEF domain-containing protein [Acholeplasmataceae bacterium]HBS00516.1 GGDEF domain-containing protein [Acholeplasmataceae bacterium]HCB20124.1 GGDEF domain-containing protein [Acholeplasmataceae bacterium]